VVIGGAGADVVVLEGPALAEDVVSCLAAVLAGRDDAHAAASAARFLSDFDGVIDYTLALAFAPSAKGEPPCYRRSDGVANPARMALTARIVRTIRARTSTSLANAGALDRGRCSCSAAQLLLSAAAMHRQLRMKRTASLVLAFVPLLLAAPVGADIASVPQPITVIENATYTNVTATVTGLEQTTATSPYYSGYVSCSNLAKSASDSFPQSNCVVSTGGRTYYCFNFFSPLPALNEFAQVQLTIRKSDGRCIGLSVTHSTLNNGLGGGQCVATSALPSRTNL
jgi:hypothetical protein